MGSLPVRPSVAVGRLLREKRKELRLTLREVSERIAEKGERLPTSTLARIEQGKLDPGVRRLHLLLRLYQVPQHLVGDLVELESLAIQPPVGKDLETLHQEGVKHWKSGNVAQGLAYVFAVREHVPADEASRLLRQKATLTFANAARDLGKFQLAKHIVEDLLCEPPHPSIAGRVLVLASAIWRGLGSSEVALALVRQAATHVRPEDDQEAAWVLHQEAGVLLEDGRPEEAHEALKRALSKYRAFGDTYGETRGLILRGKVFEARGDGKKALETLRHALRLSASHGHAALGTACAIELGRLLVASGREEEGLTALRKGLGEAVVQEDRSGQFYAHYNLWKAHEHLGDSDRARFEIEAARYFVRFTDQASPEANEIRKLTSD